MHSAGLTRECDVCYRYNNPTNRPNKETSKETNIEQREIADVDVGCVVTYHLPGSHANGLDGELASAHIEEVLETGTE